MAVNVGQVVPTLERIVVDSNNATASTTNGSVAMFRIIFHVMGGQIIAMPYAIVRLSGVTSGTIPTVTITCNDMKAYGDLNFLIGNLRGGAGSAYASDPCQVDHQDGTNKIVFNPMNYIGRTPSGYMELHT